MQSCLSEEPNSVYGFWVWVHEPLKSVSLSVTHTLRTSSLTINKNSHIPGREEVILLRKENIFMRALWWDLCLSPNYCKNYKTQCNLSRAHLRMGDETQHVLYTVRFRLPLFKERPNRAHMKSRTQNDQEGAESLKKQWEQDPAEFQKWQKGFFGVFFAASTRPHHPFHSPSFPPFCLCTSQLRGISRGIVTQCQPALTLAQRQEQTAPVQPCV